MNLMLFAGVLAGGYWVLSGLGMLFTKGTPRETDKTHAGGLLLIVFGIWAAMTAGALLFS